MKRILRLHIGFVASILWLLLCTPSLHSDKSSSYVGWKQCEVCHDEIVQKWKETRHAEAIESLKKSSQENLAACVKCHVTGYEEDGGFLDYELTPEMAGVQCEECHGRGSNHIKNPGQEGVLERAPGVEVCRRCHTDRQDPGFNHKEKSALVH